MGCNVPSRGSVSGPKFGGASFGKGRAGLIRWYFLDYCFTSRITATFLTGMAMLVASATAGLRLPGRGFYKRLLMKMCFGAGENVESAIDKFPLRPPFRGASHRVCLLLHSFFVFFV